MLPVLRTLLRARHHCYARMQVSCCSAFHPKNTYTALPICAHISRNMLQFEVNTLYLGTAPDSRWESRHRCRDNLEERSCDELKVLLILSKILIWCFRGVEIIAMARRQRSHGLNERHDQITQIAIAIDLRKSGEEPRARRVASEEGGVAVCSE